MLVDTNTRFITIPNVEALFDKRHGTGEKTTIQAIVNLDAALDALEAGQSLHDIIEHAKLQVEHDILGHILVAADYDISAVAQLLNLDSCTVAAKIQSHFSTHSQNTANGHHAATPMRRSAPAT